MTYGELFREIARSKHGDSFKESRAVYADTVAPQLINRQVPEEWIEEIRKALKEKMDEIDALTEEQREKMRQEHLAKN